MLCGDVNIAHQEIDLKNFKGNKKNSGFLPEERAWMTELLRENAEADAAEADAAIDELTAQTGGRRLNRCRAAGGGMVDVYRMLKPHHHRRGLHLVEQPRPGVCEECRLASRLPPGDTGHGSIGNT